MTHSFFRTDLAATWGNSATMVFLALISLSACSPAVASPPLPSFRVEARSPPSQQGPAPAPRTTDAEKTIRDYYVQSNQSSYQQSVEFLISKMAPDFTDTDVHGKLTHRTDMVNELRGFEGFFVNPLQVQYVIRSFKWHNDHAVVEEEADIKSPVVLAGRNHEYEDLAMTRDVWSLVHGAWMVRSTVTTAQQDTMDGRPWGSP